MPTQLERAQQVCADFIPNDPPGEHYVYVYRGVAIQDSTPHTFLEDGWYAERCYWYVEWTLDGSVCYVGKGNNGRINKAIGHPVFPKDNTYRYKLRERLSANDAALLEELVIAELGHILDTERTPGCLVNIRRKENGSFVCPMSEAFCQRCRLRGNASTVAVTSVKTYVMDSSKSILATSSMAELSRQFSCATQHISACCLGTQSGIWSPELSQALYFCKAEDYETYTIKPMTTNEYFKHRVLIAQRIDGSDICAGTAADIANYAPESINSSALHRVAQGERKSCFGWAARYADEESADEPVSIPYSFF